MIAGITAVMLFINRDTCQNNEQMRSHVFCRASL